MVPHPDDGPDPDPVPPAAPSSQPAGPKERPAPAAAPVRGRGARRAAALALGALALIWGANEALVAGPVRRALNADGRNRELTLRAHYAYYVDPSTVVFDLRRADAVAPIDVFRALFQASGAVAVSGRSPDQVVLARAGHPVFVMRGPDVLEMGRAFAAGENPVYLVRTLPEKLYEPGGRQAYGTWTGGMLGVLGQQMNDANAAATRWAVDAE